MADKSKSKAKSEPKAAPAPAVKPKSLAALAKEARIARQAEAERENSRLRKSGLMTPYELKKLDRRRRRAADEAVQSRALLHEVKRVEALRKADEKLAADAVAKAERLAKGATPDIKAMARR